MSSQTIIVQIDEEQLKAQKANKYKLYLAKKVNGAFTVVWQAKAPLAEVNNPSYQQNNVFNIAIPSYQVNYTNNPIVQGSVTFTSSGKAVKINLGQTVKLDEEGVFGKPSNTGQPGTLTVLNSLAAYPHEILNDEDGNPVFVNIDSGMAPGAATLTPIDEYQLWFDNYQDTGTIIAHNVSHVGIVVFSGSDSETISYNKAGQWQPGPLAKTAPALAAQLEVGALAVGVVAVFKYALSVGAVTYLLSKFIDKFAGDLRPTKVVVSEGATKLEVTFAGNKLSEEAVYHLPLFDAAVNKALNESRADKASELVGNGWDFIDQDYAVTL